MPRKVIITCALTGGGALTSNSRYVPITPEDIAREGIAAANAGAAVVHIHVRDPKSGKASMELQLYREVVGLIRESGTDVILNLTTGMGASYHPPVDVPSLATTVVLPPAERVAHVMELRPEICTLDVATMNFDQGSIVNAPSHLRYMAGEIYRAGTKPELEVFDLGQVGFALYLLNEGTLKQPPFFQFCLGIRGGAPATPEALLAMKGMLPAGTVWSAFGISRAQFPIAAQSVLLGGHVRVGLEDNLFIGVGELAKGNAQLVERAVQIVRVLGEEVATAADAREILSLTT